LDSAIISNGVVEEKSVVVAPWFWFLCCSYCDRWIDFLHGFLIAMAICLK
jgi:hypothetical protein